MRSSASSPRWPRIGAGPARRSTQAPGAASAKRFVKESWISSANGAMQRPFTARSSSLPPASCRSPRTRRARGLRPRSPCSIRRRCASSGRSPICSPSRWSGCPIGGRGWLMDGQDLEPASRIAARLSGDSTVACSWAFVQAVEGALDFRPPPRAVWLRGVMAELERIANHLGDIGAICNDAAFAILHAECGILREAALRTCARAFGHRLMMDRIVPGGVAADLTHGGEEAIRALCGRLSSEFPELIELYDNTASLQDRTAGTGVVSPALAAAFAAPGFVGRASGRAFDARVSLPYAPYDTAPVEMVVRQEGDVDARVWVRILEVERSISWLRTALSALPAGPVRLPSPATPATSVECTAMVEGFRGDILAYVRIGAGRIERCHLRDPSWFHWPLLEAAIEGNIVADFPLCNKSFNCSYSGHDL